MGTPTAAASAALTQPARIVSLLTGLAAAWVAVGSTGLLGHGLRRALTAALLKYHALLMAA